MGTLSSFSFCLPSIGSVEATSVASPSLADWEFCEGHRKERRSCSLQSQVFLEAFTREFCLSMCARGVSEAFPISLARLQSVAGMTRILHRNRLGIERTSMLDTQILSVFV